MGRMNISLESTAEFPQVRLWQVSSTGSPNASDSLSRHRRGSWQPRFGGALSF
jgi:hypothetical protein